MTQLYSTGPASLWVRTWAEPDATPSLLGWGERAPLIRREPMYLPIPFDLTAQAPASRMLVGETASAQVTLVRYSEAVVATLQAVARSALLNTTRGFIPPGGLGSILDLEGGGFQLWVLFPHAAKPVYQSVANGPMPRGYYFPNAYLEPNDTEPGTTTPKKERMAFTCLPRLNMAVYNEYGTGEVSAYSTDDADLAPVLGLPWA